ncbi:PEP-CTERM sorting domain-containing protein [Microcystis sp. LE19-195.1E]|uniref:PEP-CTERM sorting domain-containing protein n=1 Tax=Microcystis sp. LE19-195.1E TaxID=3016440 RepID=UPI0022CCAFA4|nr:PEP-CTERM sorting domain-containing protein [Microcystis sp. LE19-195.1E]MCZ8250532.1 PEP-CTERM sorting domain-containing protein [Microcystis sp. LE19-195.1E]
MTNQLLKALCLPAVTCAVFSAIPAHAAIFTATYTGTVAAPTSSLLVDNVTAGDTAVITYQLDNGGTSLLSQTWNATDIVTVTFNFGNGAHVTTFNPNGGDGLSVSTGSFVTNASGQLTAVPSEWYDDTNVNVVSTNSTQTPIEWYVNGFNGVYYTDPNYYYEVNLTNVEGNIDPANWTIQPAQIQTTPEPGTLLGLLAVGSLGLLARKRQ